jgi:hypothetical protein
MSTNFFSHSSVSIVAIVNNPRGGTARLSVNEFQGIPETPEGIREFRIIE